MITDPRHNLASPVHAQAARAPERVAIVADGERYTYADLIDRTRRIAAVLSAHGLRPGSRVGILGSRSVVAVETVLAAAWIGVTYVPLGLRWPEARLISVLERLKLDALVADPSGMERMPQGSLAMPPLVLVPAEHDIAQLPGSLRSEVISLKTLPPAAEFDAPAAIDPGALAYIIFTSGTTGVPKGVMVTVQSASVYFEALGTRKALTPEDRTTHFTELSFDPSIGEIFLPWYAGATMYIVPPITAVSPVKFVREHAITVWGSAPAAIAWMRNTRALQPGALPTLRYSSFGGEPLTADAVRAWQEAAPHSVVDNLYGPTEATVDCCGQRVEPGATPIVTPGRGVLAIGTPHPGSELAVLDENLHRLPPNSVGEIAISGAQVSLGYLDDPQLTSRRFRTVDGTRWYLTGDLGMQDASGVFHHLGRTDHQIKIHGHRVELEEIEAHTREAAGTDQVAAVAWPMQDGVAQGIACFVAQSAVAANAIRERLRQRLPAYMVPTSIRCVDALPLSSTGKLDRQALTAQLARPEGASR